MQAAIAGIAAADKSPLLIGRCLACAALRPCGRDRQRYEKRQLDGGREPARPNHEIIHDRNLQYDDDEDSAACQPEIKGLVGKLFVGVDHWRTG